MLRTVNNFLMDGDWNSGAIITTVQDHADHYPCDSGDLNNVTVASSWPASVSLIEIKKLYGCVYGVYGVTGARDRGKVWSCTTQQVTPVTDTNPEFRSRTDFQF